MNNWFELFLGSELHMNLLLLIGAAIFGGTIGGRLFQKLRIPQVVGYIVIGVIIGDMGIKLISSSTITSLTPINYFALGIIGFIIGGELKLDIFRKFGKQFFAMVLAEGLGAFFVVTPLVGIITWFFTHDMNITIALALVIGAISAATDPASTVQVLWEYKSKGPLTTAVLAIVALDDALALALYALATSIAGFFVGSTDTSIMLAVAHFSYELIGALALGASFGFLLKLFHNQVEGPDKMLPFTIGLILVLIGLSQALHLDIILASMAFGAVITNILPRRSTETFELVKRFAPPIYVLFFVFVGARLNISSVSAMMGIIIVAYLLARSLGKIIGVYLGARMSGAVPMVQRFTGMCLFTQGGVAVGLSIMASQRFGHDIGELIIMVITTTTFIVQLIGPICIRIAVERSGEANKNITEDDLLDSMCTFEALTPNQEYIYEYQSVKEIFALFANSHNLYFPVINTAGMPQGVLTIENIKQLIMKTGLEGIVLAHDVMEQCGLFVNQNDTLRTTVEQMKARALSYAIVVGDDNVMLGIIEHRDIEILISTKICENNL